MSIHQVRVLDKNGNEKNIITSQELNRRFWKSQGLHEVYRQPKDHGKGICARVECGCEFQKSSKRNKFCKREGIKKSQQCQAIHNRDKQKCPTVVKQCRRCGEDFTGTIKRIFCNDPCRS